MAFFNRSLTGRSISFVISQAAYGDEGALKPLKCFSDWTGAKNVGIVIASVGSRPVADFPEYLEEARQLGKKISVAVQMKEDKF